MDVFSTENLIKLGSAATAIASLITVGVPALAKAAESFSLFSRRRITLQRIRELTDLLLNIKNQGVLTESMLKSVSEQIEAEIHIALEALSTNRQQRQSVIQRNERRYLDLAAMPRAFLIYRPHGLQAWIAHVGFFVAIALFCFSLALTVVDVEAGYADIVVLYKFSAIVASLGLVFMTRYWALRQRARWQEAYAAYAVLPSESSS